MPLDTSGNAGFDTRSLGDRDPTSIDSYMPTLDAGPDIGAALKAAREFRGLTLQDVADATRVRRSYLAAIEEMRLDELPSRPFTIGYIRAYAKALGLDGEVAVTRFKAEDPVLDEPLREPVGVRRSGDPRLGMIVLAGALVVAAIVAWNVAQRSMTEAAGPAALSPDAVSVDAPPPTAAAPEGPLALGAPLPAPVESTTPTLYETPGLEAAAAVDGSVDALLAAEPQPAEDPEVVENLPGVFLQQGAVYGAPAERAAVTLQARRSASLIVRGGDGSVYFARQLAAGEAYRAPALQGLVVDVSEPDAFQVFVAGRSKGLLPSTQASVSSLAN